MKKNWGLRRDYMVRSGYEPIAVALLIGFALFAIDLVFFNGALFGTRP